MMVVRLSVRWHFLLIMLFSSAGFVQGQEEFPKVVNTQNPKDSPPTPEEAWRKITVPEGFQVTLFAGEPDVQQPIDMHIDHRGRVWIAESYTYAADLPGALRWDAKMRDRVVILEDTNNDGRFDKRKIFWDQGRNLSSVTTGFGGVWVLCAPNLLFIPDANHDDIPDGPPQVVLDGWIVEGVGHNIVNGLTWGPDGWLYGRHGIMNTSLVGVPGTPPEKRTKINTGIWRYHPTKKVFEVVCHGTTNPWGLDFDDQGEMFFTNNVIGHLWHVIPGAHFKRMYGEDFNPHLYDLIDQHADHYHWDTGKSWTASRQVEGLTDKLGGGHSHVGAMIYLGDNWPKKYRNTLFMCNTHGRRINNDRLVRHGNGYVGQHNPDLLFANNPWFRGIALRYGPDGGVYLSDWTDIGECHDHDGVHRTSGRIYKITYGKTKSPKIANIARLSNSQLVQLQLHDNDYYVRQARLLLQERCQKENAKEVHQALSSILAKHPDITRKLRALWALYVTDGIADEGLQPFLRHDNEHMRVWAIRLLVDDKVVSPAVVDEFVKLAKNDQSGLVRLYLASALQRLPLDQRSQLADALLQHASDASDHNMPLMIWYGIEPMVPASPDAALQLLTNGKIPLVRKYIARRLTANLTNTPNALEKLIRLTSNNPDPEFQTDVVDGMNEATQGWRNAKRPKAWPVLAAKLEKHSNAKTRELVRKLSIVFGDGRALDELKRLAMNANADGKARRDALQTLIESRPDDLLPMLRKLANDRATVTVAIRGLSAFSDADLPQLVVSKYRLLRGNDKSMAIDTLVSRANFAQALLQAVERKQISPGDISAFQARQIRNLGNAKLNAQLSKVWGEIQNTPAEQKQLIEKYKKLLTSALLAEANHANGRKLFEKNCANCHKLFGEGKVIGPDLTGGNRDNIDYLLENIVAPNAVVPVTYKISLLVLKDGRNLTGVIGQQSEKTLVLQTQTEQLVVNRGDIEEIQPTSVSLMPEGLLNNLSNLQVRDLVAYLMSRNQVPLPAEANAQE